MEVLWALQLHLRLLIRKQQVLWWVILIRLLSVRSTLLEKDRNLPIFLSLQHRFQVLLLHQQRNQRMHLVLKSNGLLRRMAALQFEVTESIKMESLFQ